MKSFNQFAENLDKAAAIRQRQQDAVARFKQSGESEASAHSDRIATNKEKAANAVAARKQAKQDAEDREQLKNEIKRELKNER